MLRRTGAQTGAQRWALRREGVKVSTPQWLILAATAVASLAPLACDDPTAGALADGAATDAEVAADWSPPDATATADAILTDAFVAPTPLRFRKRTFHNEFRSESVTAFDVDGDGDLDLVTDQFWYAAPEFTPVEVRAPETFEPAGQYSRAFGSFAFDVDGDGDLDHLVVPFPGDPMHWYENPHPLAPGAPVPHWPRHRLADSAANESPAWVDLAGDGRMALVMGRLPEETLVAVRPGADPRGLWDVTPLSGPGAAGAAKFSHGLGVGDLNGDGRNDVVVAGGWYEAPATPGLFAFHPADFQPGGAQMVVHDLDGDGRADVIGSAAHDFGLWWYRQGADGSFTRHLIDDTFSELHAMRFEDLDADGRPELITGKRWYAHGGDGPGGQDAAVLYVFRLVPDATAPGGVRFVRENIDTDSGVGTQLEVLDLDGDGRLDLLICNKKGLFVFTQE